MTPRCTKAKKQARLEQLADLIVKGHSHRQLVRIVREEWGLKDDSITRYIRQARDLVKSDMDGLDRKDLLAAKIQQLENIALDAVEAGRENNAIGAIRLLAELTGFGVEHKR